MQRSSNKKNRTFLCAPGITNLVLLITHEQHQRMGVQFTDVLDNHNLVTTWWRHQWKHCQPYWPFVRWITRSPVNSPHKGQWRGALMFLWTAPWINGWVNNREAGDLRCYRAHFDVIVMKYLIVKAVPGVHLLNSLSHICVSKLTIIGSDNGLWTGRRKAVIWTSAAILLIRPQGTHFNEFLCKLESFHSRKYMPWDMWS